MGVEVAFVLAIPALCAYANGDCLVDESVFDDCAEEFVA